MSGLRWLLAGLLAAVVGACSYWFFTNFERVREEQEVGYSGEARYNPYLAAERFLARAGLTADSLSSLQRIGGEPPADGVLFLFGPRRTLSPPQIERLKAWVEAGGHLLLVPRRDEQGTDPLLAALSDARVVDVAAEADEADEADRAAEGDPMDGAGERPVETLLWGEQELRFAPGTRIRLEAGASAPEFGVADAQERLYMLHYYIGAGALTVLDEAAAFSNAELGAHDHAAVLHGLVGLNGNAGKIWFVYGDGMPPLWRWLAERAPAVLGSGALILLLWLWGGSRRFGPRLPAPPPVRRRLREHVLACGRFLWRRGQPGTLLGAAQQALREQIHRRHPGWLQLAPAEFHQRLAEHCGLTAESVRQALGGEPLNHPTDFIRRMQLMDRIRARLDGPTGEQR